MELQRTIKSKVDVQGVGLHTGKRVSMRIYPAAVGAGIIFKRSDLEGSPTVKAHYSKVVNPNLKPRRTSIGEGRAEVQTVEHLMSALAGSAIDNVTVELDGEEVPGLDGSSKPFVELIKKAGIIEQEAPKRYAVVKEPLWLEEDGASLAVFPSSDYRVSYTLSYGNPNIGTQYASFLVNEAIFENEIAPSRTFCLASEVEKLRAMGLGKGATYENTIVVSDEGIIENRLRFKDEFVRHKISDLIGDLNLLGMPIKGHVVAVKSGHTLNIGILKKLSLAIARQSQAGISVPVQPLAGEESAERLPLKRDDIKKILPHREPFLFVDEILELQEDRRAVGIKYLSQDDYYFAGHFPGKPVMPGVLIMESLAQVAGVLMLHKRENRGKLAFFIAMNEVKFRRTVLPGDTLRMEIEVMRIKTKTGQVKGMAYVDDKLVAQAELMFTLVER